MPNLCKTLLSLIFTCICVAGMAQDFQQHTFNIYFKTNSDEVSTASMAFIRQQLLDIGTANIREIKVKGHADSDATDSFNIKLSQRRAQNTYNYFLTQGVPENLISSEAFGESVPMSDLKSLNRRAEIILVYDYATSISDLKSRKFVIKGRVSNFNTLHPMACTFVIEDKKLNVFKSTGSSGIFWVPFVPGRGISLTFSKEGFLNHTAQISPEAYKSAKGDTIFLDIALKPVEVYEKIVFEKIFFFSDSDSLRPESKPDLDKLTNILKADKSLFVEIQGHMNCPVSRPMTIYQKRYNHELSHKRAKAIYKYLISRGIPAGQLTFKGMSNFNMIYPEPKNEAEADKNKRVEVWKLRVIPK
jgi:outer membrane protein OmpA-like peptidoglycan-associated protein